MKAKSSDRPEIRKVDTTDGSIFGVGCVCRIDTAGKAVAAQANSEANSRAVGIYQGHAYRLHPLGTGVMEVFLVAGLNSGTAPAKGQKVYLSAATAGKATNVAPGTSVHLGIIQDLGSGYDNTNGSLVTIVSSPAGPTGAAGDATAYSPADAGDWDTPPTTIAAALDELAARIKALE